MASRVLEKPTRVPDFPQAYEVDGRAPEEFSRFGAFATTANQFAAATRKSVDFAARSVEATRRRAA